MAGSSLLALIDDIATVLDDISVMTKVAAKKTAGVLGDDLALNTQQVTGVHADRELAVVWAVARGSFINKLILVPSALALSALLPQLITPLLILGGLFLCFEGVEKIWHHRLHPAEQAQQKQVLHDALMDPNTDMTMVERDKIQGAIRTDFILSAEIVVIALGTAAEAPLATQALVISLIALVMTIGVYGLVALIVKLDDIGLHLQSDVRTATLPTLKRGLGTGLLAFCPVLMKTLSVVGTAAMFLVGGGILTHGIPFLHHPLQALASLIGNSTLAGIGFNLVTGVVAGAICVLILGLIRKIGARRT
jgi:predicted DNA repair protein MutK